MNNRQEPRKVLAILADGFEEVEALGPIDVLRRAGAAVTVAGLDALTICGSHGVGVVCDALLADVMDTAYDAVVLPGGMPGAQNLHDSRLVSDIVLKTFSRGSLVCAICASPAYVLAPLGILKGRKATCYPGCESAAPDSVFCTDRVVTDGNVITGKGPGAALEFGLEIARSLYGEEVSSSLHDGMMCR